MNQPPKAVFKSTLRLAYETLKVIELGGTWPPEIWRERMRLIEEALKTPKQKREEEGSEAT